MAGRSKTLIGSKPKETTVRIAKRVRGPNRFNPLISAKPELLLGEFIDHPHDRFDEERPISMSLHEGHRKRSKKK